MSYELTGKLFEKFETIQRTESFRVREFVIEKSDDVNGKTITNYIKFQIVQDRVSILDPIKIGDEVKVSFNIRGSKWQKDGKTSYFSNLDAWRIQPSLAGGSTPANTADEYLEPVNQSIGNGDNDDLPF